MLLVLAACGRFDFDPQSRTGDAASDDAADGAPDAVGPELRATLSPAVPAPGDRFGYAVAVSGDGQTIAISAPSDDTGATDAGATYVFVRTGGTWSQQAMLQQPAPATSAFFGVALALSHDGSTLAVGADGIDSSAGAVEIYTRTGASWSHQATLEASVRDASDALGTSVALSADGNTLVAGALLEDSAATGVNGNAADNSATNAGAAYVFVHGGTTWTQDAYLKAANTDAGDEFGTVAISGDGTIVAVAALAESSASAATPADNSLPQAGAVYVFRRAASWSQVAYVKEPTPDSGAFFGDTLAFASNGAVIVAGAPGNDSIVANSGAAYAMHLVGNVATFDPQLKLPMAANNDQLGTGIAIAGNGIELLAGAIFQDDAATDSGAVERFTYAGGTWAATEQIKGDAPAVSENFGQAIATSDDGRTTALGDPVAGTTIVLFH